MPGLSLSLQEIAAISEQVSAIISDPTLITQDIAAITENIEIIMSVLAALVPETIAITEDIYGQESGLIGNVIC